MKNNISNKTLFLGAALLTVSAVKSQETKIKKEQSPNIIFILADDLGYGDLSCYGQTKFSTPNIDQLAKEGVRFTQHYAGTTVSAPSRASLMTGMHTGCSPIRGNKGTETKDGTFDFPLPANIPTVAECLKKKNYATACIGKWGLGGPNTDGHPNRKGFDYFYGNLSQLDAHFYFPEHLWENEKKVSLEKDSYTEELIINKACDFVKKNKDKPFFLYFTTTIPHAELNVPDSDLAQFKGKYPEKEYVGNHYCSQKYPHAAFAAMVTKLDNEVGRLHALLKELGIDENTLIIFTSDNGPHLEGGADPDFFNSGGGLRGYKRDLYEGGIRVPFIACWPRVIESGRVSDHVSAFWDFMPTACEIAKVKPSGKLIGISYLPELEGKKQKQHPFLYWEFHEQGGKQAVRIGNWKAVRLNAKQNPTAPLELFNLENDLAEKTNLAEENPDIIKRIEKLMSKSHIEDSNWPFFSKP